MTDVQEAEKLAEPVIKEVVNCISEKRYAHIEKYAELSNLSLSDFTELIEGFLEINELSYIDGFDVPCTFRPEYEYHRLTAAYIRTEEAFGQIMILPQTEI